MAVVKLETVFHGKNGHTFRRRKPCLQHWHFFYYAFSRSHIKKKKTPYAFKKPTPKKKTCAMPAKKTQLHLLHGTKEQSVPEAIFSKHGQKAKVLPNRGNCTIPCRACCTKTP
jgi:hypothetical protein